LNKSAQLLCTHSGLLFAVLMGIGIFGVAGWLPPQDPGLSAVDVANLFQRDQTRIRIGMTLLALASVFFWSFSAAIATQLRRIEGRNHVLAGAQLASASGTVFAVLIPSYVWLALSYRPDATPPATMQLLNDLSWLSFVGMYPPALLQNLAVGLGILSDRRDEPLFPRWVGFANLWLAVCYLVGALLPFFKRGPFAWTGLFGFWVAAVSFFSWIAMMWWSTRRAIRRQTAEP
jgi:hypothetical protein